MKLKTTSLKWWKVWTLKCQGVWAPFRARVNFLMLICSVQLMLHPRDWVFCTKSYANALKILGLHVSLLMTSPFSWFWPNSFERDICWMIFHDTGVCWKSTLTGQCERTTCWLTLKCRNSFEKIIQDNDFKIKLGHGVSHKALEILCGSGPWGALSLCLPVMNFTSMWELSGLLDTL